MRDRERGENVSVERYGFDLGTPTGTENEELRISVTKQVEVVLEGVYTGLSG